MADCSVTASVCCLTASVARSTDLRARMGTLSISDMVINVSMPEDMVCKQLEGIGPLDHAENQSWLD